MDYLHIQADNQWYNYYFYHPTNLSTKYLVVCMVYTDVSGIKLLYHGYPPVREIIHSLKLVDYLHVQADLDNPWYRYYFYNLTNSSTKYHKMCKVYTAVGGIK